MAEEPRDGGEHGCGEEIRTPSALLRAVRNRLGDALSEHARVRLEALSRLDPQQLASGLTRHYLALEQLLVEDGASERETLREWLRHTARSLLVDPDFALVLAPELRQVRELGLRLLRTYLQRALATLHEPDDEIESAYAWIASSPEDSRELRKFGMSSPLPVTDGDWPVLLAKLSDRCDARLRGKLGTEAADRLLLDSLSVVAEDFGQLPSFGAIVAILPGRLLTTGRVGELNRDQLVALATAKSSEVGELVRALASQGEELGRLRDQLRRSRSVIAESVREFRTVLDAVGEGILTTDVSGTVIMANRCTEAMWGCGPDELFGRKIQELLSDAGRGLDPEAVHHSWRGLGEVAGPQIESEGLRPDGTTFPIRLQITQTRAGDRLVFTLSTRDAQRRETSDASLRESHERYALAVAGGEHGLWDWNLESGEVFYSAQWKAMLGLDDEGVESTPRTWMGRLHPDEVDRFQSALRAHLEGRRPRFEFEHRVRHADGTYRWMLVRGQAVFNDQGRAVRIAGSQIDLTERKVTDPLTGLPNRVLFMDRVRRAMEREKNDADYHFAVLFIDLDGFKVINDSLGHVVGDQLLLAIAQRLAACVRGEDMVARMGGDEFTVLLDGIASVEDAKRVADRFQKELKAPFYLRRQEVFTGASVGIALGSGEHREPDELLRDADTAMYRAKALGKARYEVFDLKMRDRAVALLQLHTDLRRAVQRDEFELHYQPIVSLETGEAHSFEALVRWRHPDRGLIPPGDFIAEAEETGLIVPIGRWVLREAGRQITQWRQAFEDVAAVRLSVNISPRQFMQEDLAGQIRGLIEEIGASQPWLNVEITETLLMQDDKHTVRTLNALRELDVGVSIDDFGTGYSSLSALHRFPIDMLKIDRSFVSRMDAITGENVSIVETIIGLAHNLGMKVTAEGVETAGQLKLLKQLDCDYWQGFYYTKPVPSEAVMEFLGPAPKSLLRASRRVGVRDSGEVRRLPFPGHSD